MERGTSHRGRRIAEHDETAFDRESAALRRCVRALGPFALSFLAALALFVSGGDARADERPSARIDYAVEPGTACPDEAAFRERVTTRLGYDPFVPEAATTVTVRFATHGTKVSARIDVAVAGSAPGTRRLDEAKAACSALADTAAAAVAMAIDPVGRGAPAPKTEPPKDVAEPPPVVAPPPPPVAIPPRPESVAPVATPIVPVLTAHAIAALGTTPGPTLGGTIGVGLRRGVLSLHVEARFEATPTSTRLAASDRVTGAAYGGTLLPCASLRWLHACVGARFGAVQATALDVDRPVLTSSFTSAIVARATAQIPMGASFAARVGIEAGVPLVRTTFSVASAPLWTAPLVHGTFFVGLAWMP